MIRRRKSAGIILGTIGIAFLALLFWPVPDFSEKYSSVVLAADGSMLGASIAGDGQWRFPETDTIPDKLKDCILTFEDQYFYFHPGVNPVSILRAMYQNISGGKIVSGASTITMQVARMRYGASRTYLQKLNEIIASFKLELLFSKEEILKMYVSHAPYGGNVVGIEAAGWRYFNREITRLSWAESALLAVLPNDPAGIFPGKEDILLLNKRNFLLKKLLSKGHIDSLTYDLAVAEPLPEKPFPLPNQNHQLLQTLTKKNGFKKHQTSIDLYWQNQTWEITSRYHKIFKSNGVENLAALTIDLNTGKILSYIGNTSDSDADGYQVDVVQRPRSSGSLLKPILFAFAIDRGLITPKSALPDIPTFFAGFTPKNFNEGYEGIVNADDALSRSLNIPFVHLLREYNYLQFQSDLHRMGFTTIRENVDRYGLSLVLGGAEVTLWDVAKVYFELYQVLKGSDLDHITLTQAESTEIQKEISSISIWHMFNAMTKLSRPGDHKSWEQFSSAQKIAWKTGTSFGFRDAWAVGLNGNILAAVWVGNADGEGRAGLVGSKTAGPILLELLSLSEYDPSWLEKLKPVEKDYSICKVSGRKATIHCMDTIEISLPPTAERIGECEYHFETLTEATGNFRVNSSCYPMHKMKKLTVFSLPPHLKAFYTKKHLGYSDFPPIQPSCMEQENPIAMIYPTPNSSIYIPRGAHGKEKVVLQATHQVRDSKIYWHLDEKFLGATTGDHKQSMALEKGTYALKLVDQSGNELSQLVRIISK